MFAEVNTTNLRKSFYKKRDLLSNTMMEPLDCEKADEPIFDSFGEELVAHTSKNRMNELILANNAKQANGTDLGKRSRSEAG